MDTLKVHHFLRYLPPKIKEGRTEIHWKAYHFCIAVKEGKLGDNSRFMVKIGGQPEEISAKNADKCRPMFGAYLSSIATKECGGKALVVPVPSKDSLVGGCSSRCWSMVEAACAGQENLTPLDAVRFTKSMPKASTGGGTRNAKTLYEAMKVVVPKQRGKVILVDDLFTSGAHMKAALARLTEAGFDVCCGAVCGLVVNDPEQDPKVSGSVDMATSLEEPRFEDIFSRFQDLMKR